MTTNEINEMKKIAKCFANDCFKIVIIAKSIYVDAENKKIVCNGYNKCTGDCKELYFDFENKIFMVQKLSGVCIHENNDYSMQFQIYLNRHEYKF